MNKIVITAILLSIAVASFAQELIHVKKQGKGQPMILIHGLYCSSDVWEETVRYYQDRYECHLITLAGFAGKEPALQEPFLDAVSNAIIQYTKDQKLKKPVIMGHSMGAFLSIWSAAKEPALFSGVIAVDGLPFLSALQVPGATEETARPMAENMRTMMKSQTPEQVAGFQRMYLPSMINDPAKVELVANMAIKSHSPTIAQVMYEMYTTDLRQTIKSIESPVLVLGAWIAYKDFGATLETTQTLYKAQFKEVKNCQVEMSDKAKHFIFFDEPEWFLAKTEGFLNTLK